MCLSYLKQLFSKNAGKNTSGSLAACEEQLDQIRIQLSAQEKMASIGLLTAGIAHEIKNPLNFVNNFSRLNIELIKELEQEITQFMAHLQKPDNNKNIEESKEMILNLLKDVSINCQKIQEHGKRAENTVQAMLVQSRKESETQKEPTSINKLLEEYANLAYHGMRALTPDYNVKFEKHLDEGLAPVKIFPQAMGRVFLNIINNALYAANQQKEGKPNSPTITLTTENKGDTVIISIKDNGPGIPEANKQKIFEPLFTTKPTGQGTGLGLSISHDIITKEHGGELKVNSVPGEYTEFTIVLPKT